MSRKRSTFEAGLSPRLVRLIQAARAAKQDAAGSDVRSAADTLEEMGLLASWAVPVHGLFVPNNSDVCMAIEHAAKKHLGLDDARRELRKRLKVIEAFEHRDAIESTQTQVRAVYDEAYFYAGLAFGVTFVDVS
jgi:hypothetical protein